jgi:hypothetical protein
MSFMSMEDLNQAGYTLHNPQDDAYKRAQTASMWATAHATGAKGKDGYQEYPRGFISHLGRLGYFWDKESGNFTKMTTSEDGKPQRDYSQVADVETLYQGWANRDAEDPLQIKGELGGKSDQPPGDAPKTQKPSFAGTVGPPLPPPGSVEDIRMRAGKYNRRYRGALMKPIPGGYYPPDTGFSLK